MTDTWPDKETAAQMRRDIEGADRLQRDLELANAWIDVGISMAQKAVKAFARGLEAAHPPGTQPQAHAVETLRTVADLLEHLKHEPHGRGPGRGEEALGGGDAEADPHPGRPGPAD